MVSHNKFVERSKKLNEANKALTVQDEKIKELKLSLKEATKAEKEIKKSKAELEKQLSELEASHETALKEADAKAYDDGVQTARDHFAPQVDKARSVGFKEGFQEGWIEALKKSGLAKGHELFSNILVPNIGEDGETENVGSEFTTEEQTPAEDRGPEDASVLIESPSNTFTDLGALNDVTL